MTQVSPTIECDALIFDLDGTLWDTSETCAAAWNQVGRPLFIGDTQSDCDAATANGCRFVHCDYGFGTASSADAVMGSFAALPALLRRE